MAHGSKDGAEALAWHPSDRNQLATCSVDKSLKVRLRIHSRHEHTLVPCSSCLLFPMLSSLCLLTTASLHVPQYKWRAGGGGAVNEIGESFSPGKHECASVNVLRFCLCPQGATCYVVVLLPDSVCALWFRFFFPECDAAALSTSASTAALGGRCGMCDQRTERLRNTPPTEKTSTSTTVPTATTSPWGERLKKSVVQARECCQ